MSSRKKKQGLERARTVGAASVLEGVDASLLDIVDHVLTKGIVLTGDVVLGVADVELIYLRLSALLCAFDRIAERQAGATPPERRRAP